MAMNAGKSYDKITLYFDPNKADNRRLYKLITEACPKYKRSQYLIEILIGVFDEKERKTTRRRRNTSQISKEMAEEIADALLPKLRKYAGNLNIEDVEDEEPIPETSETDVRIDALQNLFPGMSDDDDDLDEYDEQGA